jgi:hypothetical protein
LFFVSFDFGFILVLVLFASLHECTDSQLREHDLQQAPPFVIITEVKLLECAEGVISYNLDVDEEKSLTWFQYASDNERCWVC